MTPRCQPVRRLWPVLALCGLSVVSGPAPAAVAILSVEGAPELVLVDADKLDAALLTRLAVAGFGSAQRFETGCEVVDAGLLADRLARAKRVIAVLSATDADLVESLLQGQRLHLRRNEAATTLGRDAPVDLRDLRDALGEAALALRAIEAISAR